MSSFLEIAEALYGKKRNVFFSFHYDDIMRVNNVRMSGQFKTNAGDSGRSIEGFYDYSLWESRKLEGEEALRNLIRQGVQNTSAVCVLIGTNTWQRPWVRYEIARSVIDGRGLMAVHLNNLNHHKAPYGTHALGENPLRYLGVALNNSNNKYYLCERVLDNSATGSYKWIWYSKHTHAVDVPKYMPKPELNNPIRLSDYTTIYDWVNGGHQNIGSWIDTAAQQAGR